MILLILLLMITHFACCLISEKHDKNCSILQDCQVLPFDKLVLSFKQSTVTALFGLLQIKQSVKNLPLKYFKYWAVLFKKWNAVASNVHTSGSGSQIQSPFDSWLIWLILPCNWLVFYFQIITHNHSLEWSHSF